MVSDEELVSPMSNLSLETANQVLLNADLNNPELLPQPDEHSDDDEDDSDEVRGDRRDQGRFLDGSGTGRMMDP